MMHLPVLLIGVLELCFALRCAPTCSTPKKFESTEEIPKFLRREVVALFDKGQISVPDGEGFDEMDYRLSKPVIQPGHKYPLVLYLNGHAPRQMDYGNVGQLSHLDTLIYHYPSSPEDYPFFLLVPKCPKDWNDKWLQWIGNQSNDNQNKVDPLAAVERVVEKVVSENPIDRDRITVFGISSGGTAAWEFALRRAGRIAAIVPLASFPNAVINDPRFTNLKDVSIWAFHSSGDYPESVRDAIKHLKSIGAEAELTEIPTDLHACWDEAFGEYDLLTWMLAQRRIEQSGSSQTFSASIRWQVIKHDYLRFAAWQKRWNTWWPPATPVVALVALYAAYRKHRHRRSVEYVTATSIN